MASPRRTGTETSRTRGVLLDVTERLMLEEGYAAVTSRNVAGAAGVTPALIHYYFPSLDDLFLAVFRRGAEKNLQRLDRALASPRPLHALWEFSVEPTGTALLTEFMALANHRKSIRREIAEYAERFRHRQAEGVAGLLADHGVDTDEFPPAGLLVLLNCVARGLVTEQSLGIASGHPEFLALVERLLGRVEGPPAG